MKKLSIVFLDFDDIKNPLLGAGQAKATLEVGKRLVKKGHKVLVICSKYPGYKDRTENGIGYKHIGIGTRNIKFNNLVYIFVLPFTVKKLSGDIIIECFTAPISTLLSPLCTKIPVIALPTSFEAERFSKLYHLPFWIIEKYGSKLYKYFIALTPYLAEKMKKNNPNIITRLIPQGVSKEYFNIKNKKSEYILFMGRLDINQKGLDLLLESYSKIRKKISYPLVIAGDGPDREKIINLIEKLNLSDYVHLVGFVDGKKKYNLLSKAAFIAFPSRSEGFPLVSLEALASGNRLVAFDIPSLYWTDTSIARKTKLNVKDYSQALLAEVKFSKNKFTEKTCRNFAKQYSWDKVTVKYENFLTEIKGEAL